MACFKCGKKGHYKVDCQSKAKKGNYGLKDNQNTKANKSANKFSFLGQETALFTSHNSCLADLGTMSHIARDCNIFLDYTPTLGQNNRF